MFSDCREYLIGKLKEAGIRTPIFTSEKLLERCQDSHLGAVLVDNDTFLRNGSKRRFVDQRGASRKRTKVFDRSLTFTVIVGEYTIEKAESIFERFLRSLDRGLLIDGNYTNLEIEGADWVDRDDSILKAKIALQVNIRFEGGVYRDSGFAKLGKVEVVGVDKEKEVPNHGS